MLDYSLFRLEFAKCTYAYVMGFNTLSAFYSCACAEAIFFPARRSFPHLKGKDHIMVSVAATGGKRG